jgi:phosphinothricin acetyltransferase
MSIHLRDAHRDDVPAILDIVNYNILNSTAIYDYNSRALETQQAWFDSLKAAGMAVLVAEQDGRVIGYGSYGSFRPRDAYRFSVEHSIYVDASSQGKGVGKLLLQALIERARTQGFHTMIAGIDAANQGSIEFHRKFGFTEAGYIREVGYKFDRWLDLVFMQLIIEE